MSNAAAVSWASRVNQARETRQKSIWAAWRYFTGDSDLEIDVRLDTTKVIAAVEGYLKDVEALVNRNGIGGLIQHHKIAGLIAANLLKTQPIVAADPTEPIKRSFYDNQVFALRHALSICFQAHTDGQTQFVRSAGYRSWFVETVEFMRRHPDCGEHLIGTFDLLSALYIPDNIRRGK